MRCGLNCLRDLILLICLLDASAAGEWRRVETGSLAWFHAIQFVDADSGWAAGSNGTLLSTADGGATWKKELVPTTDVIRDIYFKDRTTGWLLVDRDLFHGTLLNRSYLLKTVDGGTRWSVVEFMNSSERFARMVFSARVRGIAIGEGGFVVSIPDPGTSEMRISLPEKYLMLAGSSLEQEKLLLVGGGGRIIWTEDQGKNWTPARFSGPAPMSRFNSIHFLDSSCGWVVGNGGLAFSTVDGGKIWRRRNLPTEVDIYDIRFNDRELGFTVGENGTILRTVNSGRTWKQANSGVKHRLERIAFSGDKAFAVGFGGAFLTAKIVDERKAVDGP